MSDLADILVVDGASYRRVRASSPSMDNQPGPTVGAPPSDVGAPSVTSPSDARSSPTGASGSRAPSPLTGGLERALVARSLSSARSSLAINGGRGFAPVNLRRLASQLKEMPREARAAVVAQRGIGKAKGSPIALRITLPLTVSQPPSTVTTGVYATVYQIAETNVVGWNDWTAIFAQYRFTRARLHIQATTYHPGPSITYPGTTSQAVAAWGIDYSSGTAAPTFLAEVQQMDHSHTLAPGGQGSNRTWECDFERLFGIIWDDMGTNFVYGTLQAYGTGFSATVNYPWYITGEVDVEFRGLV